MHSHLDLGSSEQLNKKWQQYITDNKSFSRDTIHKYWETILLDLSLPTGCHVMNMAVPFYCNCCTRSVIMDIAARQYGIAQCNIIPRPLALLMGYLGQHPQDDLHGNLLCIFAEKTTLDFSFVSLSGTSITLEYQGFGNWENMQTTAEQLGFYSVRGWEIDHLLCINGHGEIQLSSFKNNQSLNLIKIENAHDVVLEGLHFLELSNTFAGNQILRIIYPYDFYLQKMDPIKKNMTLEKIPFDTANLEIDLTGSYRIASLSTQDLYVDPQNNQFVLSIYEMERMAPLRKSSEWPPAMIFQGSKDDLPGSLELWLNMTTAEICLNAHPPKIEATISQSAEFIIRQHKSQRDLYKLLENSPNHKLKEDFVRSFSSPYDTRPDSLEKHLETIRLKLYGLLQLWSNE